MKYVQGWKRQVAHRLSRVSLPLTTHHLLLTTLTALATVTLLSGCEKLPWESKAEPKVEPAAQASTPPPSTGVQVAVPPQEMLAKVNQAPISKTDVELSTLELKRFVQASGQDWKPLPAQDVPDGLDLTDILNNLIDGELKAQEVRARSLDLKPEFKRRLAYLERGFFAQEWDRWQREREAPTDQDIRQFYEQNKAGFQDPERIRVRMIITPTLSEAESIRATAVQGSDFAQLAREHSVGPGKDEGGEAGWYVREVHRRLLASTGQLKDEKTFFEQLEPVVFALQDVGQVSMPVKGPDNRYYVVKLEERKPARQRTELEVHDSIRDWLTIQRIQKELDQLRAKAKVETFPEHLKDVTQ